MHCFPPTSQHRSLFFLPVCVLLTVQTHFSNFQDIVFHFPFGHGVQGEIKTPSPSVSGKDKSVFLRFSDSVQCFSGSPAAPQAESINSSYCVWDSSRRWGAGCLDVGGTHGPASDVEQVFPSLFPSFCEISNVWQLLCFFFFSGRKNKVSESQKSLMIEKLSWIRFAYNNMTSKACNLFSVLCDSPLMSCVLHL